MKSRYTNAIITIALTLSVLSFIWNCTVLDICINEREHNALEITDENRETVKSLLYGNIEDSENIPDMANATQIEYLVLMHKDEITISYGDTNQYRFFIRDAYKNPLTQYIKNEGYKIYLHSPEFTADLAKAVVTGALSCVFIIILVKRKRKITRYKSGTEEDYKDLELRKLSIDDGHDVYEMLEEFTPNEVGPNDSMDKKSFDEFKEWLFKSDENSALTDIADDGRFPQTTYWLFESGIPVGYGKIRPQLTDAMREKGGNIGYAIRPTARGRGLGTRLLALLLVESKKMGLESVLLTIKSDNRESVCIAIKNGGTIKKITSDRYYICIET